jgi:uncharacterized membrane protein
VWRVIGPQAHRGGKRPAEEEGRTHVTDTVVLVVTVASLAAVVTALARSSSQEWEPPADSDVAYPAFTVGMSVLSYLSGTVVVASGINLVADLAQS